MKNHPLQTSKVKSLTVYWPIAAIAVLTWFSILICLDPAGSYPHLPQGPGLTIDELFNVEQGVYLVKQTTGLGWLNLIPGSSQEAFQVKNGYNPDHPPLGRFWLGIHHEITRQVAPPDHPQLAFVTACARTGSATAFALTLFLLGTVATIWSGRAAGIMTTLSLLLMPRVYGHAHLASLETMTNFTCTAAVLAVAGLWHGVKVPSRRIAVVAGFLLGLAFLTKIQAIFIPIPVVVWAIAKWRLRAIQPLAIWAVTAFVVFLVGWPYLWTDPIAHISEFLGRTTNRATLQVWYFGQKYADKEVPWHYPFVMFGLTVPAFLHVLGLRGLAAESAPGSLLVQLAQQSGEVESQNWQRDGLLIGCALLPLVVFALPGIAVYDCERLFLTSFPLWAIFIGRGWLAIGNDLSKLMGSRKVATAILAVVLAIQAWPLIGLAPCHLCYYNSIFQWDPANIEKLGLEVDYWGVGITRELIEKTVDAVPEGARVAIIPTLHPFQAADYRRQSPLLRRHNILTVENRDDPEPPAFGLVYHRHADLPPDFQMAPSPDDVIAITRRGGVWIAYLRRIQR